VYSNIPVERVAEYVRRLADGNVREKVAAVRRLVYGVRCRVFFFNDVVPVSWTGNVGKILSDLVNFCFFLWIPKAHLYVSESKSVIFCLNLWIVGLLLGAQMKWAWTLREGIPYVWSGLQRSSYRTAIYAPYVIRQIPITGMSDMQLRA
jgi:hypothetical protein